MNVRSIVRMLLRGGPAPAAALLLLGASAVAGAATAAPADSPQGNEAAPMQLQEVIVTAEKRRQPLLEAPVSVTVVSGQTLDQRHEVKLADYLAQIPGISVQDNGYGQVDFSIRGIGSSPNLAPTVGVEVDGVPIGSSNAAGDAALKPDIDPNDMANIQVLYGPQGTLYGDDAMGGLIEYTTVKPDLSHFSGRVEADVSQVQGGGVGDAQRAMVNLPVIDGTLALRITGFLRHDPGFIDDVESGQDNVNDDSAKGGRVDVLWQIAGNASLRLNALAQDGTANGDAEEILNPDYQSVNGDLKSIGQAGFNGFQSKYRFYTATLDIDLGWAHLLSLSGYNTTDFDAKLDLTQVFGPIFGTPPFVLYPLGQTDGTNKFSQEIRLTSPSNQPLEWIGGLYYTREQTSFAQTLTAFDTQTNGPFPGFPTSVLSAPLLNPPTTFHDYAGYLTLTYHFSPKFDVEAGGRYTTETTDVPESSATGLIAGAPTPASSEKDDATTFLASGRYHISADEMAYLRVASGFRPGGSNGVLPGVPPTYGPDKTINYELGYKGAYLDKRLEIETALFYIDWSNIQLEALNEYSEGFTVNGNKAKSQGAQFSGQYLIGDGFSAQLSLTYTDAAMNGAGPASSGATAGAALPYANRWSGNFSLEKRFPITPRWQGSAQVVYNYFGDRYGPFNSVTPPAPAEPQVFIPDYSTVDFLAGITDGRYSVNLFLRNLSNARGITSLQAEGGGGNGNLQATIITPRTIGLSLTANF
ncbi:MAG TPA: TonB-dependent receptor [Steroidobacteraceae bacterium]|nr:TonB-dependent receptor [Steroidobacteraceae bacterium]